MISLPWGFLFAHLRFHYERVLGIANLMWSYTQYMPTMFAPK